MPGPTNSQRRSAGENIANRTPSELKDIELNCNAVKDLSEEEIATLCAGYVVRYDDKQVASFTMFKSRILKVFEKNEIDGALMADRNVVSSSMLTNLVVKGLKEDDEGEITFGAEGKIKQFFNSLN